MRNGLRKIFVCIIFAAKSSLRYRYDRGRDVRIPEIRDHRRCRVHSSETFERHAVAGCDLVAAHDVFDSVGMIDGYFPRAYFTTDPDDFRKRMVADRAEFLTVCTPNYLHCTHTVTGLEAGLDVICEKPLALTPDELSRMETCSRAAGRRVFPILQLRLHPEIERLKRMVDCAPPRQFMM